MRAHLDSVSTAAAWLGLFSFLQLFTIFVSALPTGLVSQGNAIPLVSTLGNSALLKGDSVWSGIEAPGVLSDNADWIRVSKRADTQDLEEDYANLATNFVKRSVIPVSGTGLTTRGDSTAAQLPPRAGRLEKRDRGSVQAGETDTRTQRLYHTASKAVTKFMEVWNHVKEKTRHIWSNIWRWAGKKWTSFKQGTHTWWDKYKAWRSRQRKDRDLEKELSVASGVKMEASREPIDEQPFDASQRVSEGVAMEVVQALGGVPQIKGQDEVVVGGIIEGEQPVDMSLLADTPDASSTDGLKAPPPAASVLKSGDSLVDAASSGHGSGDESSGAASHRLSVTSNESEFSANVIAPVVQVKPAPSSKPWGDSDSDDEVPNFVPEFKYPPGYVPSLPLRSATQPVAPPQATAQVAAEDHATAEPLSDDSDAYSVHSSEYNSEENIQPHRHHHLSTIFEENSSTEDLQLGPYNNQFLTSQRLSQPIDGMNIENSDQLLPTHIPSSDSDSISSSDSVGISQLDGPSSDVKPKTEKPGFFTRVLKGTFNMLKKPEKPVPFVDEGYVSRDVSWESLRNTDEPEISENLEVSSTTTSQIQPSTVQNNYISETEPPKSVELELPENIPLPTSPFNSDSYTEQDSDSEYFSPPSEFPPSPSQSSAPFQPPSPPLPASSDQPAAAPEDEFPLISFSPPPANSAPPARPSQLSALNAGSRFYNDMLELDSDINLFPPSPPPVKSSKAVKFSTPVEASTNRVVDLELHHPAPQYPISAKTLAELNELIEPAQSSESRLESSLSSSLEAAPEPSVLKAPAGNDPSFDAPEPSLVDAAPGAPASGPAYYPNSPSEPSLLDPPTDEDLLLDFPEEPTLLDTPNPPHSHPILVPSAPAPPPFARTPP